MPIVILTGQATPDLRKSDGGNVTRCAAKDKDIVFRLLASAMATFYRGLCSGRLFGERAQKNAPGVGAFFRYIAWAGY